MFAIGSAPSTRQVAMLAQAAAFVLQEQSLSERGPAALQKWAQHSFRVAGAQMFARANVPVPTIQVIGRWGSMPSSGMSRRLCSRQSVQRRRFVRHWRAETARQYSLRVNGAHSPGHHCRRGVGSCSPCGCRTLAEFQAIRNPRSKFAHRPSPVENTLSSEYWASACGKWHHGRSNVTQWSYAASRSAQSALATTRQRQPKVK